MSDPGRSLSHPSSEESDTTVVIQAPPTLPNDFAAEQCQPPVRVTAVKYSLLSSSSSPPPTAGTSERSQHHHSQDQPTTRESTRTTHTSLQVDTAAVVTNGPATSVVSTTADAEVMTVSELKNELYRVTHSLVQARQQARMSNEMCAELRQRCQGQEAEKQALRLELQESQERLRACQARTEEQRRSAAEAKLTVLSLTAERDELSAKVQEAWDRVAELSTALRRQEAAMQSLQMDITHAGHSKELIVQENSHLEQQLRVVQEQLSVHQVSEQANDVARQRLSVALQRALGRVAELLSNVAYDYQQSLLYEGLDAEDAASSDMPVSNDAHVKEVRHEITSTKSRTGDAPHVVLFPANSRSISATTETALMETQPLQRGGPTNGSACVYAENVLHSAETVILGDLWSAARLLPRSSAPLRDGSAEAPVGADADPGTATPPERRPPLSSSLRQGLVQSHHQRASPDAAVGAEVPSSSSSATILADEASMRTALTPLLLGLKHVAAMLSNMRHERRRWVAKAVHFKQCYEGAQRQLEAAQHVSESEENQAEVLRGRVEALQLRAEQANAALLECRQDDMRRLGNLAHTLKCAEDWALVQHSVELLQVRQSELRKDLQQLREQRQIGTPMGTEHAEKSVHGAAAAEDRYQQLLKQYLTLQEWVEAVRPAASHGSPQLQSLSSQWKPPPPPPAEHGAVPAPAVCTPANTTGAVAPVGEQSRSSSTCLHCSFVPPEAVSASHRCSEKETRDPDAPLAHNKQGMHGGGASPAPRETASASPAAANGSASTSDQQCVGHTSALSTPRTPTEPVKTDDRVHTCAPALPLRAGGPTTTTEATDLPRFITPRSTTYPVPLDGPSATAARQLISSSAGDTEHMLLASLRRDQGRSWPTASALSVTPSHPSSTRRYPSSGSVTSPKDRRHYANGDADRGGTGSAMGYSSMFAAEVLHVIEALDRRVSGALDRSPHA
ncbi:hypothetical protein JKF63_05679 [Porcisia hertigi]|uniref:Uncharacterized protein n=1 Tax=Porcisia hertigi TaxID=2761500 RepID=A0A836L9G8_9TRYP|nr:hypothetical protein JKF63_05679 [Porcisia hertigi]